MQRANEIRAYLLTFILSPPLISTSLLHSPINSLLCHLFLPHSPFFLLPFSRPHFDTFYDSLTLSPKKTSSFLEPSYSLYYILPTNSSSIPPSSSLLSPALSLPSFASAASLSSHFKLLIPQK
eukprot:gb/GEZN01030155.1/.p1 GENE.gb/GEZN01030155.1/~~gb/GEZN01030155.1/.p1  ORF type:complete len:123 (+),score=17.01 gb/GEZN01030155.1/:57-425(+)